MFAKATSKFVSEIDPDGCLIPVSRLNESDNLTLLSLVIKRNRYWFWQRPKYLPSDFSLNHILLGDEPVDPGMIETDFLKYKSTLENNTSGAAEAGIGPGNVNLEGKGSSKLASSFGNLKKQEMDVQKVLRDTKTRRLDLQHSLVRQTLARRHEVFALVKERIVTTQTCSITEEVQGGASCAAFLGLTVPKKIQVSVKNGSHHSESNVCLEIPAKTALAYCLIELSVKNTGHFELCLLSGSNGGFEVDGPVNASAALLYGAPPEPPLRQLQNELEKLQEHFEVLSGLPVSTRSALLRQLTLLLKDRAAIGALDLALEDLCLGKQPDLGALDKVPSLKEAVQTTLELLQENEDGDHAPAESVTSERRLHPSVFTATSVLTSALEEMSDSTLSALESCCQESTLQALHLLVQNVTGNRKCSVKEGALARLAGDEAYDGARRLFASSGVTLRRDGDSIQAHVDSQQGHQPLILCVAICGLASLAPPVSQTL
ncbi:gasdermin Eb [Trichomycterus rosablanca]|uniref:gasdermin Eb n=1 Tax=Trichomycterus rosablanca TaxID=2290929 RepID=UPI002F35C0E3